jgi:hypothetical protein
MQDGTTMKGRSLVFLTGPLIIYEFAFALYVIYYTSPDAWWFRFTYTAAYVALAMAAVQTYRHFTKWQRGEGHFRSRQLICFVFSLFAVCCYLISILTMGKFIDQTYAPNSEIVMVLMGLPPVVALIIYLAMNSKGE